MQSVAERLASLSAEDRGKILAQFSADEAEALLHDWRGFHARPDQIAPDGDWDIWLALAGRGWGKALALDTPVPTPSGWSDMGSLRDGSVVFDERGEPCNVRVHPVQIGRPCVKLVFSDGSEVVCDEDHLWLTWDKSARKAHGRAKNPTVHPCVRETSEIMETLKSGRDANHSVLCAAPLRCPSSVLPIEPYSFGQWLGDGSSNEFAITTADAEVIEWMRAEGYEVSTVRETGNASKTYRMAIPGVEEKRCATTGRMLPNGSLHSHLKALGVYRNKHIPAEYLRADKEQRLALLQGLMDSDGYIDPSSGKAEFCTTSKALAEGVFDLAAGLGLIPKTYTGRAKLDGRDCGEKFRVSWLSSLPVVRLARKLAALRPDGKQANRRRHRYIVAAERVPSVPVRCITVDSPSRLYLCGRAMIPTHNTRTGAEWVRENVENGTASRIALVAETAADARDVMVAELIRIFPKEKAPLFTKSARRIDFHNGAKAWTYNATEPDQLRGPQHDLAWSDELAKWRYARETWDMLQFGLRLGDHPRQMVTTTPRPIELIKAIIAQQEGKAVVTRGRTMDNRANLAPSFLERIEKRYGGTRLGRQELNAEILSDLPGALWSQQAIDGYRVPPPKTGKDWRDVMRDDMERIVVAVDPAITAGEESDEHGIVVAGIKDHVGYVLEDGSLSGSPVEWARRAVSLSTTWGADGVVIEVNQGGDMVAHTLRTVAPNLNIIEVRASRGKHVRAEPIAALYEQGRARHVGQFPELEAQMTQMTQEGYEGDDSPDRLDAMVWALTELFPDMVEKIPDASKVSPIRKGLQVVSRGWMGG